MNERHLARLRTFRGYSEDEALLAADAADEIDRLRRLVVEHHAAGILNGTLVGDVCPVCEELGGPNLLDRPLSEKPKED